MSPAAYLRMPESWVSEAATVVEAVVGPRREHIAALAEAFGQSAGAPERAH